MTFEIKTSFVAKDIVERGVDYLHLWNDIQAHGDIETFCERVDEVDGKIGVTFVGDGPLPPKELAALNAVIGSHEGTPRPIPIEDAPGT